MAAKTPASKAPVKGGTAKKSTVQKAKPKGLQLNAAQWKAYNKAYKATATLVRRRLALMAYANNFRKYRLAAAHGMIKSYNASKASAQAAAIAAHASRMSWVQSKLAHQNSALQARIEHDMAYHGLLSGRAQYVQAGEKVFAHDAVMRTVDTAQALKHENLVFAQAAKAAKKASKSTVKKKYKVTANSKAVASAAQAAGLAAIKGIKGGGPTGSSAGSVKAKTTASAHAKATAKATLAASVKAGTTVGKAKAVAAGGGATGGSAVSKKAAPAPTKGRTCAMPNWRLPGYEPSSQYVAAESQQSWLGDESTPNCVVTAIANCLLLQCSHRVDDYLIKELTAECGDNPSIESVLWLVYRTGWPYHPKIRLGDYSQVEPQDAERAGLVIGFEVATDDGPGDHAALTLDDGEVVSWGSVIVREELVEEAWELTWKKW